MTEIVADPTKTDPDKYKVIFENEKVRILEYRDNPGDITHEHAHPEFILYALKNFKRKIHFKDGKEGIRDIQTGDIITSKGETHIGENIGDVPSHAIMIEFKQEF